jgi:hypothetical protein
MPNLDSAHCVQAVSLAARTLSARQSEHFFFYFLILFPAKVPGQKWRP